MILFYNIRFVISIIFVISSIQAKAIGAFLSFGDYPGLIYNAGIQHQSENNYFSFGYGASIGVLVVNASYNYHLIKHNNFHMGPGLALGYATSDILPNSDHLNIGVGCTWDLAWMLPNGLSIRSGVGYMQLLNKEYNKGDMVNSLIIRLFRLGYEFQ